MGYAADMSLRCDGWCTDLAGEVTHLDEKGFGYCSPCAERRKGTHRCRKLTGAELAQLRAGRPLEAY